jgi:hypothetical protein
VINQTTSAHIAAGLPARGVRTIHTAARLAAAARLAGATRLARIAHLAYPTDLTQATDLARAATDLAHAADLAGATHLAHAAAQRAPESPSQTPTHSTAENLRMGRRGESKHGGNHGYGAREKMIRLHDRSSLVVKPRPIRDLREVLRPDRAISSRPDDRTMDLTYCARARVLASAGSGRSSAPTSPAP